MPEEIQSQFSDLLFLTWQAAPNLRPFVEQMRKHTAFAGEETVQPTMKAVEALLQFYAKEGSRKELNDLGPAEIRKFMFLSKILKSFGDFLKKNK